MHVLSIFCSPVYHTSVGGCVLLLGVVVRVCMLHMCVVSAAHGRRKDGPPDDESVTGNSRPKALSSLSRDHKT